MSDLVVDGQKFSWKYLDWPVFAAILALHVGCVAAFVLPFRWEMLGLALVLWWICGGLGICLCYHRLLTHKSFKTPDVVKYFLTILGNLNWQGSPIHWVGIHRLHHHHSDEEHDPHSPRHGFTWAHILWCMVKDPNGNHARAAARDLQRDKVMAFLDRYYFVPQFILAGLLFVAGAWNWGGGWSWQYGLAWVVWGVCIRTVFVYHSTWFVNSASHTWGYRNFQTTDNSRNTWWVSILGFGEGWHNNHHALQRSAAHGMRWWEFDLTYLTIRLMALLGLAWDVVTPDKAAVGTGNSH
ncbi:MAG: fatty acid desaturase [Phycisphaerales bacterium]|nr:fatty acid desaturase [Phycisphaerales bacterium]